EGLTDLANTEGELFPSGSLDIGKVDKNTLGRFRTKVDFIFGFLGNALISLKHQVKLADIRKVFGSAVGADNIIFLDECRHLSVGPSIGGLAGGVLDQLIGAMPSFT